MMLRNQNDCVWTLRVDMPPVSRWVLCPFYYSCATHFQIAPAVSQGTYGGPVAQALELYNNYLSNNERHTIV